MKINIKNKFMKSLRFRILLILIFVGIVPTFVIKYGIISSYESRAVSLRVATIRNLSEILVNQISTSNYMENQAQDEINAQLLQLATMFDGRVMVIGDDFKIIRDTYGLEENKVIISENIIRCFQGNEDDVYNKKSRYIGVTVAVKDSFSKETVGVLLISASTDYIVDSINILAHTGTILQLIWMLVVFVGAYFLSGILVKPFGRVTKSIEELTDGYMDEKISIPDYTETELISEAFNKMLARMKVLDDSRQEFVSNVSHELKTPITSMKVLADSLLVQEDAPAELYKEFMQDIAEEIDRENKIINDLLSLVKMDKKASDLNIQTVNINELIELLLKRLRPIAKKQNIELILESFRPVSAEVDEVKLTLAISNLIENAIKYNNDDGWVHVSLNADHKYFYIKVADSGMGIPDESIDHIFERFYRVDKSHSREIGGTGLGLAITRNAILMHRGAIKVYSKEGEGTTFTVRIPLNYIA